jgi:hypothetical protein
METLRLTSSLGWASVPEVLLPTLVAAGYAVRDDDANTWRFTKKGVARYDEIVIEGPH